MRWTLIGIGALITVGGGVSIFRTPRAELLYNTAVPLVACVSGGCLVSYTLEVGNSGLEARENVRVRLRSAAVDRTVMPPSVLNFGKVPRPVKVSDADGVRTYELGSIAAGGRVEVRIPYHVPRPEDAPGWGDILVAVDADGTAPRRGDAAATGFLRLLFAVFG